TRRNATGPAGTRVRSDAVVGRVARLCAARWLCGGRLEDEPARAPVRRVGGSSERVEEAEEGGQRRAPDEQANDELPTAQQQLGRDQDEGLHETTEVHAQDAGLLGMMALAPSGCDGEHQRGPRL